jgi:hypothetical protein
MHENDVGHRSDANADRFAPTINFALSVDVAGQGSVVWSIGYVAGSSR